MQPRLAEVACENRATTHESGQASVQLREVCTGESLSYLFQIICFPFQCILHRNRLHVQHFIGGGSVVKNLPAMQELQETRVRSWLRKIPWRRAWQPTPVFLPGASHGQRSLAGYVPWDGKESDTAKVTEHTNTQHYVTPAVCHLQRNGPKTCSQRPWAGLRPVLRPVV